MKISIRHRRTYSLAVFFALTSVFLILYGCGDDDDGGGGTVVVPNSISGQATWSGSGLVNVRMDLSGATSGSVTTDASGNYIFTGLNNGTYTVTPNKPDVTFNPTSSTQIVSGPGITGVNFAATPTKAGPFIIFGSVSSAGSGLIGVTMTLSGASSATTTTDIYGTFAFTGLANGSYTITPSKTGFTFSPTDNTQNVSGMDLTDVRFIATPVPAVTYSISGQVTSNGSGLSGVTMALTGASSATTITDASGNYTFTGLDNGSYTITPSIAGITFSPTSSPRTVSGADITAVNFTATPELSAQIVQCPPSGTTNVTIQDFVFAPQNVTINANGIVKWTNNGPSLHTVTSVAIWDYSADIFDSGSLVTGATVCVQFQGTGTSQYTCTIHPAMVGSVEVQ